MYSDEDSLSKLRRGLYSPKGVGRRSHPVRDKKSQDEPVSASSDWEYEKPEEEPTEEPEKVPTDRLKTNKKVSIFFIVSTVIFLLAVGFVVYKFFFATDIMSPRNVLVTVDGPTTARAGSEVSFDLVIENTNKSDLLNTKLTIEFPENTMSAGGSGERLERTVKDLGNIIAGQIIKESFSASLFAQEGEDVDIMIYLEYGTEHSSVTLSNEVEHVVHISSSPVSLLVVPSVNSVQSGNEFEIEVDVSSNTQAVVNDVLVKANYPGGFTFISSNPSPIEGDNVWSLGDIGERGTESITIRGYLEGQDSENRYFAFDVGTSGTNNEIARLYASTREPVLITLPPIAISTSINKNNSQSIAVSAGQNVTVEINWRNLLNTPINNLVIEMEIDDDFIVADSIRPTKGFYQSSQGKVVWNQSTDSNLRTISARQQGVSQVSFRVASGNDLVGVVNPDIPIKIRAYASEAQMTGSQRNIENEVSRTVRIASQLGLAQSLFYDSGPFANSGPTPPEVGETTTYTVTWSVTNAGNSAENVSVRAALPAYVEFVRAADDSAVRYSPLTNEVVWNVGDVRENAGLSGGSVSISFQVSIVPSRSQVGSAPTVIRDAVIDGRDSFTGSRLQGSAGSLTTQSLRESGAGVIR